VTKTELMKKLEAAVDAAFRERLYGEIEIEFRAGEPTFFKKVQQEKLDGTENRYGSRF
jgi:hypothetical protein